MKFLLTSLILLTGSFGLNAQVSAEYISTQFLAPESNGVIRGLDFSMSEADIQMVEGERNNMNLIDQNEAGEVTTMNYRLNLSVSNYAKIAYDVDASFLSGVAAKLYVSNESTARGVMDYFINYYYPTLGIPASNEDGSASFHGEYNGANVIINISIMKDGSKNYVNFELYNMS